MTSVPPVSQGGVSVMMPAYNAERYLSAAIESLLAQTFTNWELLVVDDGSTDGTGAVAAGYPDPRIRVIRQANRGEAAARNVALDHVRGEYVAFLDADDAYLPRHLEVTTAYLRAHAEHAGVYTDGYHISELGERLRTLSSRRRGPLTGRVYDEIVRASDVFGPPVCVVLRREPIREHRLRFEEGIVIGPDWDFFVQFADVGHFGYVDEATCLYRLHTTNISRSTGPERKLRELAKCRERAVRMPSFEKCALEVRVWVFQDLLVNGLRGAQQSRQEVFSWPEFRALPAETQATLVRLSASEAILEGTEPRLIREWLQRSCALARTELRSALLDRLYRANPALCRMALRLRRLLQARAVSDPLFGE